MKQNILILNAARYTDKKTKELKALMNIVFLNQESIADNENFFGSNPITISVDPEKFEILRGLCMESVLAEIEFLTNARNPLKPKTTIKSLKTNEGKVFNLA